MHGDVRIKSNMRHRSEKTKQCVYIATEIFQSQSGNG